LEFDIEHFNARIPLPGIELVLGIGTDAKSIRACHDMYKYGKDIPYGLSTLKTEFIDYGITTWDGNGIAFDSWKGTPIGWPYAAYGTHNTATFGNALIQYYKLTGDSYYAKKADEVVGILTMVQNKLGKSVESRSRNREFYRAEYVGSFLPGYGVAYSFGQQDIYSTGLVDIIYWGLAKAGIFEEDPQPFAYPCLGNAEVTIPAVWTMIEYRTLNRIPSVPEIPDYVLPTDNVVVYTDHGGSYGGDGSIEICNDAVATKIGGDTGNVWKYVGNINRFRMTAVAALFQEAWATIEYNWNFTLTSAVRNWRTKLYFTIPYLHGSGGNSLTIWVELYNSEGILVASESTIPLNGYAESYGFGKMFFFNNLTVLSSLSAGTYTIKLRFKCHAGYGQLYLGYTFYPPWGPAYEALPMGLESFGYDCDPVVSPYTPCMKLNVDASGLGDVSTIGNPGFETGDYTDWAREGSGLVEITSATKYSGTYSCHFNNSGPSYDYIRQAYPSSSEYWTTFKIEFYANITDMIVSPSITEKKGKVKASLQTGMGWHGMTLYWWTDGDVWILDTEVVTSKQAPFDDWAFNKTWLVNQWVKHTMIWNNGTDTCTFALEGNYLGQDWSWNHTYNFANGEIERPSSPRVLTIGLVGADAYVDDVIILPTYVEDFNSVELTAYPHNEKYFWYWNLNNTKLGTSINYTMNPSIIYMDHDYNLTAYFSNVPPDEIISYILILGVYGQGHTNPAEGKYSYVNGTQVILTAISDGGWFTGWSIYSDGSGQYSTQNPLTITMNKDYIVIAGFDLTFVKFDFEEYSGTQKSAAYIGKSPVSVYYRYHGATAWYYLGDFVDKRDGTGDGCFQSPGIYDYCFKLQGHYPSYIYNVNLNSPEKILIVKLYRQDFIAGGGILGRRPLLMSETIKFSATILYSEEYQETYFADYKKLIYVEPYPNTTAKITIVLHYATLYFPAIEIEAENVAYLRFNITQLYEVYAQESYKQKIDKNKWTGLAVQTSSKLLLHVEGFPYKPLEIWRCDQKGTVTEIEDWNWIADKNAILLDKFSTLSLVFGTAPNAMISWMPILASLMLLSLAFLLIKRYVK
jgi:hypothetical protein